MNIQRELQLENARGKLKLLEDRLCDLARESVVNVRTRELTKQSLKKIVNQLKKEIVRFKASRETATS